MYMCVYRLGTAEVERPRVTVGVVRCAVARDAGHQVLMNGHDHVAVQMDPGHLSEIHKLRQFSEYRYTEEKRKKRSR